jgi:hypothetical protein
LRVFLVDIFNVHPATIYRLAAIQRGGMAPSADSAVLTSKGYGNDSVQNGPFC